MRRLSGGWKTWCILLALAASLGVAAAVAWRPAATPAADPCPIQLRDATAAAGITFRHTDGSGGRRYIVETVASGMATFDYDGDGLIDIYFLNGRPLPGTRHEGPPPQNRLYRNRGGFRFEDVTARAGVGDEGFGLGVCVGDYDNDGDPDLYIANFGPNVLYRNNGDGTFTDVTSAAGVADGHRVGAGVAFLDYDRDGWLDLYVANYVDFTYEQHVAEVTDGFPVYTGPRSYAPSRHTLFHNNGDGTFADVSEAAGIAAHPGPGMGLIAADYDQDGRTDVIVLNDVFGNFCWHNRGDGHFAEVALLNGLKYNGDGVPLGSMGIDAADYDHDGWLDFFQTSYQGEPPVLFRNHGGTFEDVSRLTGVSQGGLANVKWGCGFADFDNDRHPDLFYVNGHLQDNVELYDGSTSYAGRPVLLKSDGRGRFVDVSLQAGDGMQVDLVGRGLALDDLDNDGRIDVAILNSRRPATILRNVSATGHHWLAIELRGRRTNRDGVGSRVRVTAGDLVQTAEVHSGRGYQSHFGSRLHFGLGRHGRADRVEVHWLGGGVDVRENVAADRVLRIEQSVRATRPSEEARSQQSPSD